MARDDWLLVPWRSRVGALGVLACLLTVVWPWFEDDLAYLGLGLAGLGGVLQVRNRRDLDPADHIVLGLLLAIPWVNLAVIFLNAD